MTAPTPEREASPLSDAEAAELERLAASATPGPWREGPATYHIASPQGHLLGEFFNDRVNYDADLAFTIAARSAAPRLLAERGRLRRAHEEALVKMGVAITGRIHAENRREAAVAERDRLAARVAELEAALDTWLRGAFFQRDRKFIEATKALLGRSAAPGAGEVTSAIDSTGADMLIRVREPVPSAPEGACETCDGRRTLIVKERPDKGYELANGMFLVRCPDCRPSPPPCCARCGAAPHGDEPCRSADPLGLAETCGTCGGSGYECSTPTRAVTFGPCPNCRPCPRCRAGGAQ